MDVVPSIATLATMAATAEIEETERSNEPPELRAARIQKRQYIRTLHKVVEQSDIVIMVLDARDPEGCRSRMVEDEVRRRETDGKRLIFVLNKIGMSKLLVGRGMVLIPNRPRSERECSSLVEILETYSPDPTIQILNSGTAAEFGLTNVAGTS